MKLLSKMCLLILIFSCQTTQRPIKKVKVKNYGKINRKAKQYIILEDTSHLKDEKIFLMKNITEKLKKELQKNNYKHFVVKKKRELKKFKSVNSYVIVAGFDIKEKRKHVPPSTYTYSIPTTEEKYKHIQFDNDSFPIKEKEVIEKEKIVTKTTPGYDVINYCKYVSLNYIPLKEFMSNKNSEPDFFQKIRICGKSNNLRKAIPIMVEAAFVNFNESGDFIAGIYTDVSEDSPIRHLSIKEYQKKCLNDLKIFCDKCKDKNSKECIKCGPSKYKVNRKKCLNATVEDFK